MALVDMVCALAATTAVPRTPDWRGPAWCRPTLADAGPTVLSNSYDPLLGLYGLTAVPNDVLLSTGASLHVVTGPNRRGREREMGGGGVGVVFVLVVAPPASVLQPPSVPTTLLPIPQQRQVDLPTHRRDLRRPGPGGAVGVGGWGG